MTFLTPEHWSFYTVSFFFLRSKSRSDEQLILKVLNKGKFNLETDISRAEKKIVFFTLLEERFFIAFGASFIYRMYNFWILQWPYEENQKEL